MAVTGFLQQIKQIKQQEVATLSTRMDRSLLRKQAETMKTPGNFLESLRASTRSRVGIIAEIKKASPSKGPIRPDLDPFEFAQKYTMAGAAAISVLTESNFFNGTLADLKAVRRASNLPILRKDFIFSEFQIYEARAAGADSVLLITALMDQGALVDYICLSRELGMEPLVEINSEKEFEIAAKANAILVGINNRNLETLETDINVAQRLAPFFTGNMVPVAASGISTRGDIEAGTDVGIVNFLVGESIVKAEDTQGFIRELLGESPEDQEKQDDEDDQKTTIGKNPQKTPLVKICGLTDPNEARQCVELGANAIGLVFYEKSPRHLSIDQAKRITSVLPPETMTVGVFVNADHEYIMERVTGCSLAAVQLHGQESPELVMALARSGIRVIKTLFAEQKPGFDMENAYEGTWGFLVEDGRGTLPGGNARPWEWGSLGKMERKSKLILAGGLDPDNVHQAVEQARPDMVDVSSGVELSFGKKDLKKVKKFIMAARNET